MQKQLNFRFATTYKWGDAISQLHLQLMLKADDTLKTGAGAKNYFRKRKNRIKQ
jgi:hypothetical protein